MKLEFLQEFLLRGGQREIAAGSFHYGPEGIARSAEASGGTIGVVKRDQLVVNRLHPGEESLCFCVVLLAHLVQDVAAHLARRLAQAVQVARQVHTQVLPSGQGFPLGDGKDRGCFHDFLLGILQVTGVEERWEVGKLSTDLPRLGSGLFQDGGAFLKLVPVHVANRLRGKLDDRPATAERAFAGLMVRVHLFAQGSWQAGPVLAHSPILAGLHSGRHQRRMGAMAAIASPGPKNKNRSRWRAITLIGVHVAIGLHAWHWAATGRSVSPVEPSEAMQTLELGLVNAGFVFFVVSILATLVFGRFFCGWGCHIVAIQDFCSWLLGKAGWRPKPFRSRLLVWVPVGAGFYMFIWPSLLRVIKQQPHPQWVNHLTTDDFWATFPGPGIAILTLLVCGGLAVVFLGNKGFCTYGCPYGAFYSFADRFAPGKIRVTDACNGCGECTAHCTSNVRVHEEVKLLKMVQDPGCMKCFDCVDHCPNQALYYGFGALAPKAVARKPVYEFTWGQEALLAVSFLVGLYAFRGLYEQIPFLLAIGLAGLFAYFVLQGWLLIQRPSLRVQRWQLKRMGKWEPAGKFFVAGSGILVVLVGYWVVLQYHVHQGNAHLANAQAIYDGKTKLTVEDAEKEARTARAWLQRAVQMSEPIPVALHHTKLGSIALFLDEADTAEREFLIALAQDPEALGALEPLAKLYAQASKWTDARAIAERWAQREPENHQAWMILGNAQAQLGEAEQAVESYERVLAGDPENINALGNLGLLLAGLGRADDAVERLQAAIKLRPALAPLRQNLGLVLASQNRFREALDVMNEAALLEPKRAEIHRVRADIAPKVGDFKSWGDAVNRWADLEPLDPVAIQHWTEYTKRLGKTRSELKRWEAESGAEALYRQAALQHALGNLPRATQLVEEASKGVGKSLALPWIEK